MIKKIKIKGLYGHNRMIVSPKFQVVIPKAVRDSIGLKAGEILQVIHDELIVPTIVIYEVFKKIALAYDENKALIAIAHMKLGKVIDIDETISINAAKVSVEKKIPMADSLIYATAEVYKAIFYTQDEHFSTLPNVKYFKK